MPSSLPDEVRAVVADLRSAFLGVLAALPRRVQTAADLRRVLKIDNKLASQVYKIAHAEDTLDAAVLVPGKPSFDRLIAAAATMGLGPETLEPASSALNEFERLVKRHAGNRMSFDSMLTGLCGPKQEALNMQHRRAAFRAMGHILGVQAQLITFCSIIYPIEPGRFGLITLRGLLRLRRIRGDTPVMLTIAHIIGPGSAAAATRQPIDAAEGTDNGLGLVLPLCTDPLPKIRTRAMADGGSVTELVEGGIGDLHASDLVIGFVYPNFGSHFPRPPAKADAWRFMADVQTPAQDLIHDVLVHKGLPELGMTSGIYTNRGGIRPMYDEANAQLLPTQLPSESIANAAATFEHATQEPYARGVKWVMKQQGFNLADYRLYRSHLRFPVMNTVVRMHLFDADSSRIAGE